MKMAFLFKRVIPEDKLHTLNNYSFSHATLTPLDKVLNHLWWNNIHKLVPRWVAPNVLTLCGGLAVLLLNFLVFHHMPDLVSVNVPKWLPLAVALCLFLYMAFDSLDGMQARELGLSTPLGQLLDHGLDAMVTSFHNYFVLLLAPKGYNLVVALLVVVSQFNVLVISWREAQFGSFAYTSLPFTGVSEAMVTSLFTLLLCYLHPGLLAKPASALFSSCSFLAKLYGHFPHDLTVVELVEWTGVFCGFFSLFTFLLKSHKQLKGGPTFYVFLLYALVHTALPPLLPLALPRDLHRVFCVFASSVGGVASVDWVISVVSKTKPGLFHPQLVLHYAVLLVLLLRHFGGVLGVDTSFLALDPVLFKDLVLYTTVFGLLYTFLKFSKVVLEVKKHLGLPLFTVPPEVRHAKKA